MRLLASAALARSRHRLLLLLLVPLVPLVASGCPPVETCPEGDCSDPTPPGTAVRIVDFSAAPAAIAAGEDSTLSWETAAATSCELTPDIGVVPRTGSFVVTPAVTTSYQLRCDGPDGPVAAGIEVVVGGGSDGGPTPDAGSPSDGGPDDAGGQQAGDGGAADDAGTAADGGPNPDAGTSSDGGATSDGGQSVDAGPSVDAGQSLDAGAQPDSGAGADGGTTAPGLVHRWSFNTPSLTDPGSIPDRVGDADARGYGGTWVDRTLDLDGNNDYVDLPNGLISSLTDVTVETWLVWDGIAVGNWQRIWDFGTNSAGELTGPNINDEFYSGEASTHFHLSPRTSAGVMRFTAWPGTAGQETMLSASGPLPSGRPVHVALTFEPGGDARIYIDGQLDATGTAKMPLAGLQDVNSFLGRSNYSSDPGLDGAFDEVRIYNRALSAGELAESFNAGPDAP